MQHEPMNLIYVRTDKNGTKIYHDWNCPRCCGYGMLDKWINTGKVCYECGGSGKRRVAKIVKEYTPEYWAKLEARRIAKQKKYEEEHAYEIAQAKAEQDRRESEWRKNEERRIFERNGCGIDGIGYVHIGNTYPIKDQIKSLGGKWIYGSWVCPTKVESKGVTVRKIDLNTCRNENGYIGEYAVGDLIYDTANA